MLKKIVICFSFLLLQNNLIANCPVYNDVFIDNSWSTVANWNHLSTYLRGGFSGLHKVTVNRLPNHELVNCFYSSLDNNAHQVYRRTMPKNGLSLDSSNWHQLSENSYVCEPADGEHADNCSF